MAFFALLHLQEDFFVERGALRPARLDLVQHRLILLVGFHIEELCLVFGDLRLDPHQVHLQAAPVLAEFLHARPLRLDLLLGGEQLLLQATHLGRDGGNPLLRGIDGGDDLLHADEPLKVVVHAMNPTNIKKEVLPEGSTPGAKHPRATLRGRSGMADLPINSAAGGHGFTGRSRGWRFAEGARL